MQCEYTHASIGQFETCDKPATKIIITYLSLSTKLSYRCNHTYLYFDGIIRDEIPIG